MTDYRAKVREIINHATGCEENWTPDDKLVVWLVDDAADEIERLRVFERYCNRDIRAQAEEAIEAKATTGKYPWED